MILILAAMGSRKSCMESSEGREKDPFLEEDLIAFASRIMRVSISILSYMHNAPMVGIKNTNSFLKKAESRDPFEFPEPPSRAKADSRH